MLPSNFLLQKCLRCRGSAAGQELCNPSLRCALETGIRSRIYKSCSDGHGENLQQLLSPTTTGEGTRSNPASISDSITRTLNLSPWRRRLASQVKMKILHVLM